MRQISPVLEERLKLHNQTRENNADPRVSVQVTRARSAVMDSTYWTVETIRTKAGIGDIAVAARRMRSYGRPDKLFEIHVDNGVVKTTTREYPDYQKDGWQPQFDLGAGSSVAIAFDGEWKLWRKRWRFESEEKPWIMWVDGAGVLWAQHWDDATTKQELATGVVKVRAIRAWKNTVLEQNDQGIVAAYIKSDGKVYYRNYCQQEDDTTVWEYEKSLASFTGTAVSVNLFLTNDYRMGFVVENSTGGIEWFITHRNWAGMASPAENLTAAIRDIEFKVIPIEYYDTFADAEYISASIADIELQVCPADFNLLNVVITQAKRINAHQIRLIFSHNVLHADQATGNFSVVSLTVESVIYGVNSKEVILNIVESLPSVGVFGVTYTAGVMRVGVNSSCRPILNGFYVDAVGDPPIVEEKLTATVTYALFTVTPIQYIYANNSAENLTASISGTAFVVTKVGNNPL